MFRPFGLIDPKILDHLAFQSFDFRVPDEEEFENTKRPIRIRNSKKNRKHNHQKKKNKRTHNDLQHMHIKLKIE